MCTCLLAIFLFCIIINLVDAGIFLLGAGGGGGKGGRYFMSNADWNMKNFYLLLNFLFSVVDFFSGDFAS